MRLGYVDESHVRCLECDGVFRSLNHHLQAHRLTGKEYKGRHPGAMVSALSVSKANSEGLSRSHREEPGRWRNIFRGVTPEMLSEANERAWRDPERHRKASRKLRERWSDPREARKMIEPRVGQKKSEATKKAISDALKGRLTHPSTPEQLQAMHEARRGGENSPSHRKAISRAKEKWHKENPEESEKVVDAMTRGNKYFNTSIELAVQALLEKHSLMYEPQYRIRELNRPYSSHKWDFAIPALKIAIEVDGCFWHSCKKCFPDSQNEIGELEIQRDLEAELHNWSVLRFWGHEIVDQLSEVEGCIVGGMKKVA